MTCLRIPYRIPRRSSSGERLFKQMKVKVFFPGNKKFVLLRRHVALTGKGFTAEAMEKELDVIANYVEEKLSAFEYHVVQTGPNTFNFVEKGLKMQAEMP